MSELSSTTFPSPDPGMDKRNKKRTERRLLCKQKVGTTKGSPPKTPSAATPDARTKYIEKYGLPSLPKNPKTGVTVAFETALERIENGEYGSNISEIYGDGHLETCKQILFLAGRDFGVDVWLPDVRTGKNKRDA